MLNRSIHIQPKFKKIHLIEDFRKQYDPLFGLIPPHITIIFPFKSDICKDILIKHLKVQLSDQDIFMISLDPKVHFEENSKFVFAKITDGADHITKIHNILYENILEDYKDNNYSYSPHLTLGNLQDYTKDVDTAIHQANIFLHANPFQCVVDEIICEIIEKDNKSTMEFTINLV